MLNIWIWENVLNGCSWEKGAQKPCEVNFFSLLFFWKKNFDESCKLKIVSTLERHVFHSLRDLLRESWDGWDDCKFDMPDILNFDLDYLSSRHLLTWMEKKPKHSAMSSQSNCAGKKSHSIQFEVLVLNSSNFYWPFLIPICYKVPKAIGRLFQEKMHSAKQDKDPTIRQSSLFQKHLLWLRSDRAYPAWMDPSGGSQSIKTKVLMTTRVDQCLMHRTPMIPHDETNCVFLGRTTVLQRVHWHATSAFQWTLSKAFRAECPTNGRTRNRVPFPISMGG